MVGKVFEYQLQVRWSDSDRLGHVNNTRIAEYLQEARAYFITECLLAAEGVRGATVVRRLTTDFLRPLFDESGPLAIDITVSRIGTSSFGIHHAIRDRTGALCVEADGLMVAFDIDTQSARSLTDAERAVLGEYMESPQSVASS